MGSLPICSWRFVFYLCSFFGGLSVLYHVSVPDCFLAPPPAPQAPTVCQPGLGVGSVEACGQRGRHVHRVGRENLTRSWQMVPTVGGAADLAVNESLV